MKERILDLFQSLCKPFKNELGGPKLEEITNRLDRIGVPYQWYPGIGVVVNKQDNPTKVIVSHMDLIPKFQKGFKVNEICTIKKETVIGALDNTITNAVLLLVIELLKNDKELKGVEFLFSEGEEVGFIGMYSYLKKFNKKLKGTFFINLDVTNEGYNKSASIEYDSCNFKCLKEIQKIEAQNDYDFFYTSHRVCDDMDAIITRGFHGLSYCLPTKNNIHSYKNKARLDSLEPYLYGLLSLIKIDSEITNNATSDINPWDFKEALISTSREDIIKQKREIPNYQIHLDNFIEDNFIEDNFIEDFFDREDREALIESSLEKIEDILFNETFAYQNIAATRDLEKRDFFFKLIELSVKINLFNKNYFELAFGITNTEEIFEALVRNNILIHIKSKDIYLMKDFEENENLSNILEILDLEALKDIKGNEILKLYSKLLEIFNKIKLNSILRLKDFEIINMNNDWVIEALKKSIIVENNGGLVFYQ